MDRHRRGDYGLTALAAVAGIADVDAITLSLARQSREGIALDAAVLGLGVAVAVNTIAKAAMTFAFGAPKAGWIVAGASAVAIAAGWAAFLGPRSRMNVNPGPVRSAVRR